MSLLVTMFKYCNHFSNSWPNFPTRGEPAIISVDRGAISNTAILALMSPRYITPRLFGWSKLSRQFWQGALDRSSRTTSVDRDDGRLPPGWEVRPGVREVDAVFEHRHQKRHLCDVYRPVSTAPEEGEGWHLGAENALAG